MMSHICHRRIAFKMRGLMGRMIMMINLAMISKNKIKLRSNPLSRMISKKLRRNNISLSLNQNPK